MFSANSCRGQLPADLFHFSADLLDDGILAGSMLEQPTVGLERMACPMAQIQ